MLGHKVSLTKFKKIEIISSIFSDHKTMRLEMKKKKKTTVKNLNVWRLNNVLLNNQWITEKNKKEIKYLETNENRGTMIQNLWDTAEALLPGRFIVIVLPLEKEKSQNNPTLHLKELEKREQNPQLVEGKKS